MDNPNMPDKRPAQRGDTPADRNYTNARRSGRTKPGKIENRDPINGGVDQAGLIAKINQWAKAMWGRR